MGRLNASKAWKNSLSDLIKNYNYLIDLIDSGTKHEGKIGDNYVTVEMNPRDGFKITVNGVTTFSIDPLSGNVDMTGYDAEFLKYVRKDSFGANSILKADEANTPVSMFVPENRLIGRLTGSNITYLTAIDVKSFLNLQASDITYTASDISIEDTSELYDSTDVELALSEIMTKLNLDISNLTTVISGKANKVSAEDIEITDATKGIILKDRTTADRYRLFIDNGVLDIELVI